MLFSSLFLFFRMIFLLSFCLLALLALHHITVPSFTNRFSSRLSMPHYHADGLFICTLFLLFFSVSPGPGLVGHFLSFLVLTFSTIIRVLLVSNSLSALTYTHLAFPVLDRIGICCTVQCFNAYCIRIITCFEKYFRCGAIYVPSSALSS